MNPHTDIFLARIFLRDSKGFIQTLEERVFASRNEAHAFLVADFFGQETYTACRGEIVRFAGGKSEERTLFDSVGNYIEDQHPEIPMLTPGFTPKYQVGDMVRLNNDYPYKYGVVSAVPPEYESIPEEIHTQQEAVYMVEYISERGTLDHTHPAEAYMEVVDTVPDGQEFLYTLSRHYKGEEKLPDDVLKAIWEGSIYLLPTRTLSDIGIYVDIAAKHEPRYAYSLYSEKQIALFDARAGLLLCETESRKREYLGRLPNITCFSDIRLYCHAPYICVVEERGINGAVVNVETGATKELIRGCYHVEHCRYPVGFAQRGDELLLIHGTDWNRLDVMRLSDFANLTERTLTKESYDDYFQNLLNVSPGGTRFAANGWVWSPFDVIQVYELERFLDEYDKAFCSIEAGEQSSGYNWGRPICWVDERTLAVGRNPNEGKESENAGPYLPSTIELYDVTRVVEKPYKFSDHDKVISEGVWKYHPRTDTIVFDGFGCDPTYSEVYGDLYFDGKAQVFIGLNSDTGLLIGSRTGEPLIRDETFKDYQYAPGFRCFYRYRYEGSVDMMRLDTLIDK